MIFKATVCIILILCVSPESPAVTLTSAHTFNAFQLTMSMAPDQIIGLFSKRIVEDSSHWVEISTHENKAQFQPPIDSTRIILNDQHEGRHLIEYYELTHSADTWEHFHYVEVETEQQKGGYLLPSFAQKMPAVPVDSLYKCSETLVSAQWQEDDAHVSVFGEKERWILHQNIDSGFRSDEGGLYYGNAIDRDHHHPIRLDIGDGRYCLISYETPAANPDFNWRQRQNYDLDDILTLIGDSVTVHAKAAPQGLSSDL